jgi:hypothetical protein
VATWSAYQWGSDHSLAGARRRSHELDNYVSVLRKAMELAVPDRTIAANPVNAVTPAMLLILGVADGARTHDNRNHNPGLYQLSYSHR